jgi:2,4-diaminopentanoate dehydrogenase
MALRIVQWTTGNVGKESVQAIVKRPDMKLVGCYAWSPEKAGRDVGDLCGIDPIGITASRDIDSLLALQPDCVVYNPMWRDVGELVRILESGANVVSSAAFVTGDSLGADRQRIADACERGRSSMFGSGISPGFVELLAIVAAGACHRVDKVSVIEEADSTGYDSPDTEKAAGFGLPIDDPNLQRVTADGTAVFGEAVRMIGDALGVELDNVRCQAEYAQTTEDLDMGFWTIPAGCVAGIYARWLGIVRDRVLVELSVRWRKGQTLDPDWQVMMGHVIQIDGMPTIRTVLNFLPPADFQATSLEDFMVLGHVMTAVPVINAIPSVVEAPAGIMTYNDLRLPLPTGYVSAT